MNYTQFRQWYQWNPSDPNHCLGEGSFGKVYLATHIRSNRKVAVKVSPVNGQSENQNLAREVALVKKLLPTEHPNIVPYETVDRFLTEVGVFDFAILPYYAEGSLKKLFQKHRLTQTQKQDLVVQILNGIEFYQKAGIIHRDLKPDNILIDTHQGAFIPKIGDFGISKAVELLDESRFTNTLHAGTPYFAAPEQVLGTEIGLNADMWAYGVLVYWIFTNELPFQAAKQDHSSSPFNSYLAAVHERRGLKRLQQIPQPFRQMIEVCLIYDPAQRVKTATDLKKYLVTSPKKNYSKVIWFVSVFLTGRLVSWGLNWFDQRVVIQPPQWVIETKQIMVQPTRYVAIPPTFETVTTNYPSQSESIRVVPVPAILETTTERYEVSPQHRSTDVLETVSETILVKAEYSTIEAVPALYGTESEQVMDFSGATRVIPSENGCRVESIPATYTTISKRKVISRAGLRETTVPAEYRSITRKVITKKGQGGTLVPATYRTFSRQQLITAATFKEEVIPAQYSTYTCRVLKTPAKCDSVAAVYKMVSIKRLVKAATCDGDRSKVERIQYPAAYEMVGILDAAGKLIRTEKIETAPEYFTYQIVEK